MSWPHRERDEHHDRDGVQRALRDHAPRLGYPERPRRDPGLGLNLLEDVGWELLEVDVDTLALSLAENGVRIHMEFGRLQPRVDMVLFRGLDGETMEAVATFTSHDDEELNYIDDGVNWIAGGDYEYFVRTTFRGTEFFTPVYNISVPEHPISTALLPNSPNPFSPPWI